jgi:hypothetical protein
MTDDGVGMTYATAYSQILWNIDEGVYVLAMGFYVIFCEIRGEISLFLT